MAVTKRLVFIASNFHEFSQLRSLLRDLINNSGFKLEAIDLNQNEPDTRPPLTLSLQSVRRSEIMVLLVGERYGGVPPGEEFSYTHLEHRTALEEGSLVQVLPIFIGTSYRDKLRTFSHDPALAAWQREIVNNHTASFFSSEESAEVIAETVFRRVLKAAFDSTPEAEQRELESTESDEVLGRLEPSSDQPSAEDELGALEWGDEMSREFPLHQSEDEVSHKDILRRPAETAAREQRDEAKRAMDVGDRQAAIHHLRRAMDLQMLDQASAYWLAQLLMRAGRRKECEESFQLAVRLERMVRYDGTERRRAIALIVLAQAAAKLGDFDAGLGYAQQAVEVAGWFGAGLAEVARQHALRAENADPERRREELRLAFQHAEEAFLRYPPVILQFNREPALRRWKLEFDRFKRELRRKVCDRVDLILQAEEAGYQCLATTAARTVDVADRRRAIRTMSLLDLIDEGRGSAKRALRHLQHQATRLRKEAEPLLSEGALPPTHEEFRLAMERAHLVQTGQKPAPPPAPAPDPPFWIWQSVSGIGLGIGVVLLLIALIQIVPDAPNASAPKPPPTAKAKTREVPIVLLVAGGFFALVGGAGLIATGVWQNSYTQTNTANQRREQEEYAKRLREWEAACGHAPQLLDCVGRLGMFLEQARKYEVMILEWPLFSPRGRLRNAEQNQVVRFDSERESSRKGWEFDGSLLPPKLRQIEQAAPTEPRYQLFRVVRNSGAKRAVRWRSYFPDE